MHDVSTEYQESMKKTLRNRGYMLVTLGLINQEATANATADGDCYTYYSNQAVISRTASNPDYATLENDFTKVDGSQMFLPRESSTTAITDTGIVGDTLVKNSGTADYSMTINFNIAAVDLKGLTVNFGENYPIDFDITTSGGTTLEIRDNTASYFETDHVFYDTTSLTLKFYTMRTRNTRVRIYNIILGIGLTFTNKDIVDSSFETYVSPISSDIYQGDLSVTLQNYNQVFNTDNQESTVNYLETGQEMQVSYGYYLSGSKTTEWIQVATLFCSDWESDDSEAVLRAQDVYRSLDGEYYKAAVYNSGSSTLYALAQLVFEDAGVEEYLIDDSLKSVTTKNPIPRVTHREALQIIANAGCCIMTQDADGIPQIITQKDEPCDFTMERIDMLTMARAIKEESVKQVDVVYTTYTASTALDSVTTETVSVSAGEVMDFFYDDPNTGYAATLDGSSSGITISNSGAYWCQLTFSKAASGELVINAYKYNASSKTYSYTVGDRGSTVTWENPLISDLSRAKTVAEWLGEYYASNIEYEYDTRGNPELEANDIIYQENDYVDGMMVRMYDHTVEFNGGFSGKVKARRVLE